MAKARVRKIWTILEETHLAAGVADPAGPLRKAAAVAVISNPLASKGYLEDLSELIEASEELGTLLGERVRAGVGGTVESYGKGGIAGTGGEQEHVNACLTSVFGDALRAAVGGGRAWISSTTKVGAPGAAIDIPLAFKDEIWVRSHYDAIEVRVPDAPAPDEILVIAAGANRGRLGARLGGMTVAEALANAT